MKQANAAQYKTNWEYKQDVRQERKKSKTFRQRRNSKRSTWEAND